MATKIDVYPIFNYNASFCNAVHDMFHDVPHGEHLWYNWIGQEEVSKVVEWMKENLVGDFHIRKLELDKAGIRYFYYVFDDPNDALLFKLVWAGTNE